jgi:hypothetical protein
MATQEPLPSSQELLIRLARLERSHHRYRLVAIAASLACFAWTACGLLPQTKNTVTAERFVLLGADGSEKATLELDSKQNPVLLMRNGGASALVTTNGPSILLRGQDERTGAFIGIDSKNTSRLELTSHRLLDGVRLSAHEDGSSGVYVLDAQGLERGSLECLAGGSVSVSFRDRERRVRQQIGLDTENLASAILLDDDGVRRIGMVVQGDGVPLFEVADPKGNPRAQITTLFDGSPSLELKREDGQPAFRAP